MFVWKTGNVDPVSVMSGHKDDVYRVQFNQAGNRLLSLGYSGTLKIWDFTAESAVYEESLGVVSYSARLSPDGSQLITASNDSTARILEVPQGAR